MKTGDSEHACAFTGHGSEYPELTEVQVKERLEEQIMRAADEDYIFVVYIKQQSKHIMMTATPAR